MRYDAGSGTNERLYRATLDMNNGEFESMTNESEEG